MRAKTTQYREHQDIHCGPVVKINLFRPRLKALFGVVLTATYRHLWSKRCVEAQALMPHLLSEKNEFLKNVRHDSYLHGSYSWPRTVCHAFCDKRA